MKRLKNVRYAIAIIAACAAVGVTTDAKAQTANMTVDVQVTNTMTATPDNQLNFGEIIAIADAAQTASIAVSALTGTLGAPTTTGAPAYIAVIDNANQSEAQITVTDAAPGATINIDIQNVVPPVQGGVSFQLGTWLSSWNGAAAVARTPGTPWTQVYLDNAGAGSVLDLGATLTTNAAGTAYADGPYAGTFDVDFSY